MLHLLKNYGTGETETLCGLQISAYFGPNKITTVKWTHYPHQTCPECTKKVEVGNFVTT